MFRIYIIIGIVLAVSAISGGIYYMQKRIETLAAYSAELELQNKSLADTVNFLQESEKRQEERNRTLTIELQAASENVNELRKILQEHDLTRLALEKPGLIENRINDATEKVFDDIVSDTTVISSD